MNLTDQLSFQLYSARNGPELSLQIDTLAQLGYRCVEPYGGLLAEPSALVSALARHNMRAPSTHISLEALSGDLDSVRRTTEQLGTELVIVPAIAPAQRDKTADQWRQFGQQLEVLQARLADAGLRLGWHNHDFEFCPTGDGSKPMDLLLESAPSLLWEMDIGWLVRAGEDARAWLTRYANRVVAVHLKDIAPARQFLDEDGWADVGFGTIDWPALLPTLAATNTELFVLEHDNPSDFERFARRSRETICSWGAFE